MRKRNVFSRFLFVLLSLITITSFAWDRSIDIGYGYSHDPNDTKYNNSGVFLSGDFWPVYHSPMTFWSLNGSLGQWYSSAPENKNLTTVAAALALRFYPLTTAETYPVYLLASAGPAYLSTRHFGTNVQGSNLAFQLNGGLGMEYKHFDANLRMVHYSNAGLANPNEGYNILYLLSLGYLF